MTPKDKFQKLTARFPARLVKNHPDSGFHYLSADAFINRLNNTLGLDWELHVRDTSLELIPGEETRSGKKVHRATAIADLTIVIDGKRVTRSGTGACKSHDVDTAFKGSQAEALKKACNQFGIGLYLNDARERQLIDLFKAKKLKEALEQLAKIEGVDARVGALAEHYGITSITPSTRFERAAELILYAAGIVDRLTAPKEEPVVIKTAADLPAEILGAAERNGSDDRIAELRKQVEEWER